VVEDVWRLGVGADAGDKGLDGGDKAVGAGLQKVLVIIY